MKKKITIKRKNIILLTLILVIIVVLAILVFIATSPRYLVKINGNSIFYDEFKMLLDNNTTQYEALLRDECKIPTDITVVDFFKDNKAEYNKLIINKHIQYMTSFRIEQELAEKYLLAEKFTYNRFIKNLEKENEERQKKIDKGQVVYGLTSFSPQQYYSYYMSNLSTKIIEKLSKDIITISDNDIANYYNSLDNFANIDGEIIHYTFYDITAFKGKSQEMLSTVYSNIKSTLESKQYKDITVAGITIKPSKRDFDSKQLRDFIRQNFDAEQYLSSLSLNQVSEIFNLGDKIYIAQYNGFTKAKTILDNDKDVFRAKLREKAYKDLIFKKASEAEILINETAIDKFILKK